MSLFNSLFGKSNESQNSNVDWIGLTDISQIDAIVEGSKEIPGVTLDENKKILTYNIEEQCHAVFQNVKYVLEASGSSWENLIDVTVYLTNMKDDFAVFNKIYATYFPDKATQPCRTTVEVNALPTPIAIELKCIAIVTS